MSLKEYKPGTAFTGVMGRTVSESQPAWPAPVRSQPDAPNVLYIVLDDTGYGQFGCYQVEPPKTPDEGYHLTVDLADHVEVDPAETVNLAEQERAKELRVSSDTQVPAGKHSLRYEFEPSGAPDLKGGRGTPGTAKLFVDEDLVGKADFDVTIPLALGLGSGFAVGRNPGSSVSLMYASPFPFTGKITKVSVDVSGNADEDEDEVKQSQARVAMARQ